MLRSVLTCSASIPRTGGCARVSYALMRRAPSMTHDAAGQHPILGTFVVFTMFWCLLLQADA